MLILSPDIIRFEDLIWDDASAVAIDRAAARTIAEFSDLGPHIAFADVPEKRTTVRITRTLRRADPINDPAPHVGRLGTLVFYTSTELGDMGRRRVTVHCVLTGVETQLGSAARTPRATQTLTFLALSPNGGAQDPVTITPAELTD